MESLVTEKTYPVEARWIWKQLVPWVFAVILFSTIFGTSLLISGNGAGGNFLSYIIIYPLMLIASFVGAVLSRLTFHYTISEKYLNLKQGILSRQERSIPYGVIQNVFVKQDIFDRLLGLASLDLENASMGAGVMQTRSTKSILFGSLIGGTREKPAEMPGFSGNKVSIPGLKKENAELLKNIILQKMKENPVEDSQSGL